VDRLSPLPEVFRSSAFLLSATWPHCRRLAPCGAISPNGSIFVSVEVAEVEVRITTWTEEVPPDGEGLAAGQELGSGQKADQDAEGCQKGHRGHGRLLNRDGIHTRKAVTT
jgi:hypothetical protein